MPEDYLALDGNSLSTDDLRQLGKGRYKIRITKGLSMSNYPKFYLISIQILSKIKFIKFHPDFFFLGKLSIQRCPDLILRP